MLGLFAALTVATAPATDWPDRPADMVPPAGRAAYRAWLSQTAIYWEAHYAQRPACEDARVTTIETTPIEVFGGPETETGQGLMESLRVEGCGRSSRQNLQVYRLTTRSWQAGPRFPGDSYADIQLQTGAMGSVRDLVAPTVPRCAMAAEEVRVGETRIVTPVGRLHVAPGYGEIPGPRDGDDPTDAYLPIDDPSLAANLDDAHGWQEYWPLAACGEARPVIVSFVPLKGVSGMYLWRITPQWEPLDPPRPSAWTPAPNP